MLYVWQLLLFVVWVQAQLQVPPKPASSSCSLGECFLSNSKTSSTTSTSTTRTSTTSTSTTSASSISTSTISTTISHSRTANLLNAQRTTKPPRRPLPSNRKNVGPLARPGRANLSNSPRTTQPPMTKTPTGKRPPKSRTRTKTTEGSRTVTKHTKTSGRNPKEQLAKQITTKAKSPTAVRVVVCPRQSVPRLRSLCPRQHRQYFQPALLLHLFLNRHGRDIE